MVVRSGVRDREPDGHRVEEPLAREVCAEVEHELIGSGSQARSLEERRAGNDSTTELKNAFEQIGHITRGRLEKIIDG